MSLAEKPTIMRKAILFFAFILAAGVRTALAVDNNTVEVKFNGSTATVTIASNISSYVTNNSSGSHVKLVQSENFAGVNKTVDNEDGEIIYDGKDLLKIPEEDFHTLRGHRLSMIFQDPLSALNPIMRIGKQLTEAMILNNKERRSDGKERYALMIKTLKEYRKDFQTMMDNVNRILRLVITGQTEDEDGRSSGCSC